MTGRAPAAALSAAAETSEPNATPAAGAAAGERLDEESFRALHAATVRSLWAYLAAAGGDPSLADDLVQESYLRVLGAARPPRDPAHLRGYLFRTAANLLRDHWRRRRHRDRYRDAAREEARDAGRRAAPAAGGAGGERTGLRADLARLMARLEPRSRSLLWLAHVEGWSHADLADALGLKETSVRVILFRARRRLADLLRADGYAPETRR